VDDGVEALLEVERRRDGLVRTEKRRQLQLTAFERRVLLPER